MAFELGAIISKLKLDTSEFKTGLTAARSEVSGFKTTFMDGLGQVGVVAGVATAALTAVGTAAFRLGESAAQYESIRDAFSSMTKSLIDDVDEFEKRVNKASAGTLDDLTILRGGTRALSLIGKDSFTDFGKQFEEMAMLSKKAARATGQDVNFMFDSLILGVSRSSKMILDNLGVNVSLEESYKKFATAAGKATDELTIQEQKAALLQGTLEALHTNYDAVAVSSGGFQGKMQQLNTMMTNFKMELGLAVIPLLIELANAITPLIQQLLPILINLINQTVTWFQNLDPWMRNAIVVFIALAPVIVAVIAVIGSLIFILGALLNPFVLVGIAVVALGAVIATQWNGIKWMTGNAVDYVKSTLDSMVRKMRDIGGSIYDALVSPFENAWNKARDLLKKIRDALDFTKRHSPSVLDVVKSGVNKVNNALENLSVGVVSPVHSGAISGVASGGGAMMSSIVINLDGAIIGDEYSAMRVGEKIGDQIMRKLNMNIRY